MMAKEVKKLVHDPLEDDSSLFNVDFTSEGLSWVKGFYQKLETSCNEYVNACNKYVNTAGEHIKRIYDEVCEWEKPCDVDGIVSDLFLNQHSTTKDSNELSVKLQKNSSEKTLSDCKQIQPTASTLPEDSILLPLSSKCEEELVSIEDNTPRKNCMECTDSGESIQLPTEVNGTDFDEVVDEREDLTSSISNVLISHDFETGLEAIEIDDCWLDVEKGEIALIQRHPAKNMSFKKKFQKVLMPKKVHNLPYNGSTSELEIKHSSSASSFVPTSGDLYLEESTQDTLEFEWELL